MTGLNDKNVVLAGPFGLLMQNLITRITEHGADVAVVTDDTKGAQRVCQNIIDMREVSEKFGRAAALDIQVRDENDAKTSFSRCSEIFGGSDVYIDTHLFGLTIPFFANANIGEIEPAFKKLFEQSQMMTKAASSFLKSRTRGRILYLFHELDMWTADKVSSDIFIDFIEYVRRTSLDLTAQNTAVNALAVGVSEEYLLTRFAKNLTIQQSMQELLKTIPHAKLVDYNEIANMISFISSPLSSGLNGQVIRFDHGL